MHVQTPPPLSRVPPQPATAIAVLGALLAFTSPAAAQFRSTAPSLQANSPFMGGVPNGTATSEPITLTVADAIFRARQSQPGRPDVRTEYRDGTGRSLGDLDPACLPRHFGECLRIAAQDQPRGVRLSARADLSPGGGAVQRVRRACLCLAVGLRPERDQGEQRGVAPAGRGATDLPQRSRSVVLVAANLYLQALATEARAGAVHAQFESSEALYRQAVSLRQSGIVAGLDVRAS